jgi:ribose/xylose/arabinose/galactoside ABC-type transport system permease subunit
MTTTTDEVAQADLKIPTSKRLLMSPSFALGIAVVLFVVYGLTQSIQFANINSWSNILLDTTLIAIPAAFSCIVLISGGLDLSVGSVLAAGAMTGSAVAAGGWGTPLAFLLGTLVGAGIGFINGFLINAAKIPPFIMTLGSLYAVQAAVVAISGGNPIGPLPASFDYWGQGTVLGIPTIIVVGVVVLIIAHVLLNETNYGWSIRAIGGNLNAARSAGIAVRRVSISVYVLSGAASAFTGALLAAEIGSGSPTFGGGYELQAIAAAVIGGTSIYGAIGSIPGAALGALMLAVLANGLVLLHVDANWQNLFVGLVLVASAGLDVLRRGQMFRVSARRTAASRRAN